MLAPTGRERAGEVRFGRALRNPKTQVGKLVECICRDTNKRCDGRHVLLIEDTSELNYQHHAKRVSGLGVVGNGKDAGLFIHPVLVIDALERTCLGLAHIHWWQRHGKKVPDYRKLPMENKESWRWIDAIEQARIRLESAQEMTVIADREADIYQMWDRLPDTRTHLLIRVSRDRCLSVGQQKLFAWINALEVKGSYELPLESVTGQRTARVAHMHIRFAPVDLARPRHCSDAEASEQVSAWAVDVREAPDSAPQGHACIHWRLLTTHRIETIGDALRCVQWYGQRWQIEQTFRILKRQGLDVEASQIKHARRLEKLAVLALSVAVRTLQLTLAREGQGNQPLGHCFTPQEQTVLEQVAPTLEGATLKQKNPHAQSTLAWGAWVVARLGGWKGYASERSPWPHHNAARSQTH